MFALSFLFCFRCFFAIRSSTCFNLLLRCPVLASLLWFFFLLSFGASPTVVWLSYLYLVIFRFTRVSFFSLGVCLFLCLPTLPPPCVSPLCCLYFRSPGVSFSFLSLPLAPVCFVFSLRCGGSALRKFRVSGFTCLFCSASVFPG